MRCKNHNDKKAVFHCESCQGNFCQECIKERTIDRTAVHICKECGGKCVEYRAPKSDGKAQSTAPSESFWKQLPQIFFYPLKGKGPYLLLGGTVFFGILGFVIRAPFMVFLFIPLLFPYILACLVNIIRTSIVPHNTEPPQWPDPTLWKNWLLPSLFLFVTAIVCYIPAQLYYNQAQENDSVYCFLVLMGFYFLPMCFLNIGLNETWTSLNPLNIIFSIMRTFFSYTTLVVFLLTLPILYLFIETTVLRHIPLLGYPLRLFIFVYFLFLGMRALGLFYRANRNKLLGFDD